MVSSLSLEPWRLSVQLLVARAALDASLYAELLTNGDQFVRQSGVTIPDEVHLHFYIPTENLIPCDSAEDIYISLCHSPIHVDRLTHHTLQSPAEREALQLNLNQTATEQTEAQTTTTTSTAEVEVEVLVGAVVII